MSSRRRTRSTQHSHDLASTAVFLLEQYHTCPDDKDAKRVLRRLLDQLCRYVESRDVYVSEAAQNAANQRGLGDLRSYDWTQQKGKMGDEKREVFHWDHFVPVKEMLNALLKLDHPDIPRARRILNRASVAWILKSEDKKLNSLGFRANRKNPHDAYKQAGIRLI